MGPAPALRVLHAIDTLRVGGAQLLLAGLVDELDGLAVESHVLVVSDRGADPALTGLIRERAASLRFAGARRLCDPGLHRAAADAIAGVRPAVVHSHLIDANVSTRLAARRLGVPHLTTIHIPPFPLADSGLWRTLADGATARLSHRLVAVSAHAATAYARAFALRRSRIRVIPNSSLPRPVPPRFDRAAKRRELGADPDTKLVLAVCRLEPHKGLDDLIAATAAARAIVPGLRVVVAGEGSDESRLRSLAGAAGLNGAFGLLGDRADVGELLASADAFCLPSRHEGSPISVIEAMHAGLPCVATRVGGVPELLGDGAGIIVPPGAPEALARGLSEALTGPEGSARATRARAIAAVRHSPSAMAAAYSAVYRELA